MLTEQRIVAALKSIPAFAGRVYPLIAPQSVVKPFAVWTVVSKSEDVDFEGAINLIDVYFQVDVYSDTAFECTTLATACRNALRGLAGVNCKAELFGRTGYEGDTKIYRDSSDYRILAESEI
jgi:hypothetical protein